MASRIRCVSETTMLGRNLIKIIELANWGLGQREECRKTNESIATGCNGATGLIVPEVLIFD